MTARIVEEATGAVVFEHGDPQEIANESERLIAAFRQREPDAAPPYRIEGLDSTQLPDAETAPGRPNVPADG